MMEFAEVYRLYSGLVRRVLARLLPPAELDDGVQEVFIKIHRALPGFRGEASMKSWVYRISINTAQDMGRRRSWLKGWRQGASFADLRDARPDAESRLGDYQVLQYCLNQMGFKDRSVLVLFYWEDQSVEEIARALEIPEGTVKSRLSAARQRLQGLLAKEGEPL